MCVSRGTGCVRVCRVASASHANDCDRHYSGHAQGVQGALRQFMDLDPTDTNGERKDGVDWWTTACAALREAADLKALRDRKAHQAKEACTTSDDKISWTRVCTRQCRTCDSRAQVFAGVYPDGEYFRTVVCNSCKRA